MREHVTGFGDIHCYGGGKVLANDGEGIRMRGSQSGSSVEEG